MPVFLIFPAWPASHPLIVHFPIALLLTAPLFIVLGASRKPSRSFPFLASALLLMILGTVSLFLAAASGQAAGRALDEATSAAGTLERHEELARAALVTFCALTMIFGSIVLLPRLLRRMPGRALSTALPAVFLLFYLTGAISLVHVAHQGGRLVHEFGIRAPLHHGSGATARVHADRDR